MAVPPKRSEVIAELKAELKDIAREARVEAGAGIEIQRRAPLCKGTDPPSQQATLEVAHHADQDYPTDRSRTKHGDDPKRLQVSPSCWRCSCRPTHWRSPARSTTRIGRVSGRSITGSNGSTTYYDARRSRTGRIDNQRQRHHDDLCQDGRRSAPSRQRTTGQMT